MSKGTTHWKALGEISLTQFLQMGNGAGAAQGIVGSHYVSGNDNVSLSNRRIATLNLLQLLLTELKRDRGILLSSVYGPVARNGLPEVVAEAFRASGSDLRYHFHGSEYLDEGDGYVDSWFTFECSARSIGRLLRSRRIAWGMGLALGGLHVHGQLDPRVIASCPFDPNTIRTFAKKATTVYMLNDDQTELEVFVRSEGAKAISTLLKNARLPKV